MAKTESNMIYENFLDRVIEQLKLKVNGRVWAVPTRYSYDIVIKFDMVDFTFKFSCAAIYNNEIWCWYQRYKSRPKRNNEYIERCVTYLLCELRGNILKLFFK